jgi:hypothetical protein
VGELFRAPDIERKHYATSKSRRTKVVGPAPFLKDSGRSEYKCLPGVPIIRLLAFASLRMRGMVFLAAEKQSNRAFPKRLGLPKQLDLPTITAY